MKIKEIIQYLENQGEWVDRQNTRDHVLIGDVQQDVQEVIVCWVATIDVIEKAIQSHCHFIITHENPFYMSSTSIPTAILNAQKEKRDLCCQHQICIYRCHDLWDLYPEYGVRDSWAKLLKFPFQKSHYGSFIRVSEDIQMKVTDLAQHITQCIEPFFEFGIEVIGDLGKEIHYLGIGTGACTDIIEMYNQGADVCLVSDDGMNNWVYTQWAMDNGIPLLVVNHLTSEAIGILALSRYLSEHFNHVHFQYIYNDYGIHHIEKHFNFH